MIWLTWLQHRAGLAVCSGSVIVLAEWMLLVQHDYSDSTHALTRSWHINQNYRPNSTCGSLFTEQ